MRSSLWSCSASSSILTRVSACFSIALSFDFKKSLAKDDCEIPVRANGLSLCGDAGAVAGAGAGAGAGGGTGERPAVAEMKGEFRRTSSRREGSADFGSMPMDDEDEEFNSAPPRVRVWPVGL